METLPFSSFIKYIFSQYGLNFHSKHFARSAGILSFWKTPLTKALLFTSYISHVVLQFLQCCVSFSTVYPITKLFTNIRHRSHLIFCEDLAMWYTMQIVQLPYHMANWLTPHADKIEKYSTRLVCVVGVGTSDYGQRNFGFDFSSNHLRFL